MAKSAQSMLDELFAGGTPNFAGEAKKQVNAAYKPALDAIVREQNKAKTSGKTGSTALKSMYTQLSKAYSGDRKTVGNIFKNATKSSNAAYSAGRKSITSTYAASEKGLTSMMQRLGIEAAAPDVLGQGNKDEAWLKGMLSVNQASSAAANTKRSASGKKYYTDQSKVALLSGKDARRSLMDQVNNRVGDLSNQRVGVESEMAQKRQSLMSDMQSQYYTQQQQMADRLFSAQQKTLDRQQSAANAAQRSSASDSKIEWSRMGGIDKTAYQANRVFGSKGGNAMSLVQFVAGHAMTSTPQSFINKVLEENRARNSWKNMPTGLGDAQLASLAESYFDNIQRR